MSVDLIVEPVTYIFRAIAPYIGTAAVFLALFIIAVISGPVCPCLYTVPVLQVIFPVTFVLCTVYVCIDAVTVRFVVLPFTIKHITIDVPELSFAVSLVVDPLAFVAGAIRPNLDPLSVTHCPFPLALVDGSILEFVFISLL